MIKLTKTMRPTRYTNSCITSTFLIQFPNMFWTSWPSSSEPFEHRQDLTFSFNDSCIIWYNWHVAGINISLLKEDKQHTLRLSQNLTNLMHKTCFTISCISCLYMFRAHVLIIRMSKLHYTASGIITPIGGRLVHQEVKITLHSLWYHHTNRWPSRASGGQNYITQPMVSSQL